MVNDSETFKPVTPQLDMSESYADPVLLRETTTARLYRVSKAGKYFIIKTAKDSSGMSLAMLKREYEMSVSLNHYHIPFFFTYEPSSPVGPGIVMEYIDGRNLNEFLSENPSLDSRRRAFSQILDVVAYIHKNGIIHNDLKPENILISRINNDVKLLDFGLSDNDAHYLAHTLGCTPTYASPELLDQGDIDARSDIYSLGRIMQRIFGTKRYASISNRCIATDRNNRYNNVDQLKTHWLKRQKTPGRILFASAIIAFLSLTFYLGRQLTSSTNQQLTESYNALRDSLSAANHQTQLYKSQVDSIKHAQDQENAAIQRRTTMRDSICNAFDTALKRIYDKAVPIIKNERFSDFAHNKALETFYNPMWELQKQYNFSRQHDAEMTSHITSHTNLVGNEYYTKMTGLIDSMPKVSDISDENEKYHYLQLLKHNRPYTPYHQ